MPNTEIGEDWSCPFRAEFEKVQISWMTNNNLYMMDESGQLKKKITVTAVFENWYKLKIFIFLRQYRRFSERHI